MRNNQEDWEYRQGRSRRQVEDSELIITWVLTVSLLLFIIGLLVYTILP